MISAKVFRRLRPPVALVAAAVVLCIPCQPAAAQVCGARGISVQVLGSGGPDLRDGRASSSYLVWRDGQALILVDAGGGSALRFGQSGAEVSQVEAILLTHLHADHASDLPALVLSSEFEGRSSPLPIFGPAGGDLYPSTTEFVGALFAESRGAFRYLNSVVGGDDGPFVRGSPPYVIQPHDVTGGDEPRVIWNHGDLSVAAVGVEHGLAPALAWRIDLDGTRIVFSGDTGGQGPALARLADEADVFVAHNYAVSPSNSLTQSRTAASPYPSLPVTVRDTERILHPANPVAHRLNQ